MGPRISFLFVASGERRALYGGQCRIHDRALVRIFREYLSPFFLRDFFLPVGARCCSVKKRSDHHPLLDRCVASDLSPYVRLPHSCAPSGRVNGAGPGRHRSEQRSPQSTTRGGRIKAAGGRSTPADSYASVAQTPSVKDMGIAARRVLTAVAREQAEVSVHRRRGVGVARLVTGARAVGKAFKDILSLHSRFFGTSVDRQYIWKGGRGRGCKYAMKRKALLFAAVAVLVLL